MLQAKNTLSLSVLESLSEAYEEKLSGVVHFWIVRNDTIIFTNFSCFQWTESRCNGEIENVVWFNQETSILAQETQL